MSTVKNALAQKSGALIHVRPGDMVVDALRRMRENRVRSVLVIDDGVLVGIWSGGAWLADRLHADLGCSGSAGTSSRLTHRSSSLSVVRTVTCPGRVVRATT